MGKLKGGLAAFMASKKSKGGGKAAPAAKAKPAFLKKKKGK
jgi:hypothetical protein